MFLVWCLVINVSAVAQKLHDRHYRFSIVLPSTLNEVTQTTPADPSSHLYYDTTNKVVLMVSSRDSKFESVDEYVGCGREQLEADLRRNYGDTTLTLINCMRARHYPQKITVLRFRVNSLPSGFDTYVIYFVHHHGHDIQFTFTFKNENSKQNIPYIDQIMNSLKLKKI